MMKKKIIQVLKALANEKRLKLLDIIQNDPSLPIYQISRVAKMNYKTTSAYIRKMAAAGVIRLSADKSRILGYINKDVEEIIKSINNFERRK